jgi:protein-disulfide isomerase
VVRYYLVIPVAVGLIAGIFAAMYFANPQNDELTMSKILEISSPYEGNSAAPITIIEFGDYQCTFCYKFHGSSLGTIKDEYVETGKASLIFVDFPLNGPDSVLAAEASHCAKDQGKFWEYHDQLYNNWKGERTGWINNDSLNVFAQGIGLDLETFNSCLESAKYRQQVLDTYDLGQEIGINATPSFLIVSGDEIVKITGNQPIDVFRKTLDSM